MSLKPLTRLAGIASLASVLAACGAQQSQSQASMPPASPPSASSPSSGSAGSPSQPSSGSPGSPSSPSAASSPGASSPSSPSPSGPSSPSSGSSAPSSGSTGATVTVSTGGMDIPVLTGPSGSPGSPGNSSPGARDQGGFDPSSGGGEPSNMPNTGIPGEDGEISDEPPSLEEDGSDGEIDLSEETTPSGGSAGGSSSPAASGPAMSRQEQVAQMESVLQGSMSTYDGMILREREYIATRENANGSEEDLEEPVSGPLFEEIGTSGSAEQEGPGDAYESGGSGGGGYVPAEAPSGREGDYQPVGPVAPPADIPSGDDDDVVARQIREAAMNESDPVLREKLWEEYRKYKNQSN